jgi:hypothetical protein
MQTDQEKTQIAQQWADTRLPADLKTADGGMRPEHAQIMFDYVGGMFQGVVSMEALDSAVAYLRMKITKTEPEVESQDDSHQRTVALRWLQNHCPRHLRNSRGTVGPVYAQLISDYISQQYQGIWSFENLDKAVKYLTLRGELPSASPTTKGRKDPDEIRRDKILAAGQEPTQLRNHARTEPTEESKGISFKDFLGTLIEGSRKMSEASEPRKATEEKLRTIPANATPQELKKYSAAEIRNWMRRRAK